MNDDEPDDSPARPPAAREARQPWLRLMDERLAPPRTDPEGIARWWEKLADEQRLAVLAVLGADEREELMRTIIRVRGQRGEADA